MLRCWSLLAVAVAATEAVAVVVVDTNNFMLGLRLALLLQ
jgi:hypothetical protein